MNDSDSSAYRSVTQLIRAIHASDYQAVVAVTGGGSDAISQLLMVPGASRTILEARIPYAKSALEDLLKGWTGQACSGSAARAMAMAAWERARQLAPAADPQQLVGLACTASLTTDRPKQGSHRIHVATQMASHTGLISLVLNKGTPDKGARNRFQEERVAARMLLSMLAQACEVEVAPRFAAVQELLKNGEQLETDQQTAPSAWTELLLGQRQWVWNAVDRNGANDEQASPPILFPGAFNPPHAGHLQMARLAAERLARPVLWELSIRNVDKPTLDFVEITRRLSELQALIEPDCEPGDREHRQSESGQEQGTCQGIVLTATPTFLDKARLFPGSLFVVGADTIIRIGELRYYNHDQQQRDRAIDELASRGCRFLVFGRVFSGVSEVQASGDPKVQVAENRPTPFRTLRELQLPDGLRALCEEVTAAEFRIDQSSRDLRG